MQQTQINAQPQIDLSKTKPIVCSNCDGVFFKQSTMLREMSGILIGSPQNQIIPVIILRCEDCGEILQDSLPHGIEL